MNRKIKCIPLYLSHPLPCPQYVPTTHGLTSMSPVVNWHQLSPRESLDCLPQNCYKKLPRPPLEKGRGEGRRAADHPTHAANPSKRAPVKPLSYSKAFKPHLDEGKQRRVSDPGKAPPFPPWEEDSPKCISRDYRDAPKERSRGLSQTPPDRIRKFYRHPLSKSKSQSQEYDAWNAAAAANSSILSDSWYSQESVMEQNFDQVVWYPRDGKTSFPDRWYPLDRHGDNYGHGPWFPQEKRAPIPQWSQGPQEWGPWYRGQGGLQFAVPRSREYLHGPPPLSIHAGTCRIPRASVRIPRKASRRSVRWGPPFN